MGIDRDFDSLRDSVDCRDEQISSLKEDLEKALGLLEKAFLEETSKSRAPVSSLISKCYKEKDEQIGSLKDALKETLDLFESHVCMSTDSSERDKALSNAFIRIHRKRFDL